MVTIACAHCGRAFRSHGDTAKYCSQRCTGAARAKPVDPERIRALYESGMTQREVARALGVGPTTVFKAMRFHGITSRPAIKRNQRGANSPRWKGEAASYNAFHRRVSDARGKAASCSECGCTGEGKTYDWANLTGRYEDVEDYRPMCRSCHQRYDWGRRKEEAA